MKSTPISSSYYSLVSLPIFPPKFMYFSLFKFKAIFNFLKNLMYFTKIKLHHIFPSISFQSIPTPPWHCFHVSFPNLKFRK